MRDAFEDMGCASRMGRNPNLSLLQQRTQKSNPNLPFPSITSLSPPRGHGAAAPPHASRPARRHGRSRPALAVRGRALSPRRAPPPRPVLSRACRAIADPAAAAPHTCACSGWPCAECARPSGSTPGGSIAAALPSARVGRPASWAGADRQAGADADRRTGATSTGCGLPAPYPSSGCFKPRPWRSSSPRQ